MTRAQFAFAVGAEEKWLENASMLLRLRVDYTLENAIWLGLVRILSQDLGHSLARAAEIARDALGRARISGKLVTEASRNGIVRIEIDVDRHISSVAAAWSAAIEADGPKRRGRRRASVEESHAVEAAAQYGIDVELLREGLRLSVGERLARADESARFLSGLRFETESSA